MGDQTDHEEAAPVEDAVGVESAGVLSALFGARLDFDDPALGDREGHEKVVHQLRRNRWTDQAAAAMLRQVEWKDQCPSPNEMLRLAAILEHSETDAIDDVLVCAGLTPPKDYSVLRVLGRGANKQAYLGTNPQGMRKVLKTYTDPNELVSEGDLIRRTIAHPHLMDTDLVYDDTGRPFLIEEPLDEVIDYNSIAAGTDEQVNLFYELALGVHELHTHVEVAHNDLKPGNIGRLRGNYVIFDLGNSSPLAERTRVHSNYGALRTRAPELIRPTNDHPDRARSDIWSLGALIFYFVEERFPLWGKDESYPESSGERPNYVARLAHRITNEYDRYVTPIREPALRELLGRMLALEPTRRPLSGEVCRILREQFAPQLRKHRAFAPREEYEALVANLPTPQDRVNIQALRTLLLRVQSLHTGGGLEPSELDQLLMAEHDLRRMIERRQQP